MVLLVVENTFVGHWRTRQCKTRSLNNSKVTLSCFPEARILRRQNFLKGLTSRGLWFWGAGLHLWALSFGWREKPWEKLLGPKEGSPPGVVDMIKGFSSCGHLLVQSGGGSADGQCTPVQTFSEKGEPDTDGRDAKSYLSKQKTYLSFASDTWASWGCTLSFVNIWV